MRLELLELAADALEDGRDPLTLPFLSTHEVTVDECFTLAELLAIGARMVKWGLENPMVARQALEAVHRADVATALRKIRKRVTT